MSSFLSRPRVLTTGAGAALGRGITGATTSTASAASSQPVGPSEETGTLDEL